MVQSVLLGDQVSIPITKATKQFSKSIIGAGDIYHNSENETLMQGGKLKMKVMSETNSPNGFLTKGSNPPSKMSKHDKIVRRTSSKGGLKSQSGTTGRSTVKGSNNTEVGQQYFKQYF